MKKKEKTVNFSIRKEIEFILKTKISYANKNIYTLDK